MRLKKSVHACVFVCVHTHELCGSRRKVTLLDWIDWSPCITWISLYHARSWDPLQPYSVQNLGMGPGNSYI